MKIAAASTLVLLALASGCGAGAHGTAAGPSTPPATRSHLTSARSSAGPTGPVTARQASFRLPATLSRAVALPGPDGALLVLSGLHDHDRSTGAVLQVDPATGSVTLVARLPQAVHDAAGALLGGLPSIFGGGSPDARTVQQYDPATHTARSSAWLPVAISDGIAARTDRGVLVLGGYDGRRTLDQVLLVSDAGTARRLGRLAVPVRYGAAVTVGSGDAQRVLVFGGESSGVATDVVQAVDPRTGRTTVVAHLPGRRTQASALVLGGTVLVLGGRSSGTSGAQFFSDVLRYDPSSHAFTPVGRLPYPVADAAAVTLDGRVGYLIGGETPARTDRTIVVSVG